MSLLSKIHDEFLALKNRFHELVEPEKTIADKLHELIAALVAKVEALEHRVEAIGHAPAIESDVPAKPAAPAVPDAAPAAGPAAPVADTPVGRASPSIIDLVNAGHEGQPAATSDPAPASAPADYTGHDLTPGHPRINVETAEVFAEYRFTGPGTVYYQIVAGTDSGMRVTSYIVDAAGGVVSETETRVIMNKQPFTVSASGPCIFFVKPEQTGPISVGLE